MKKILPLILIICLFLVGCNKEKFSFDPEYYESSEIVEITKEELEDLVDKKASFGVYVYLPGCSSCAEFKEVLDEYLENKTFKFYSIEIGDALETEIGDKIQYAPSFILYNKGKIEAYLLADSNDDLEAYESVEGFNTWLNKYVNLEK